jgi:hypothetical protein
MGAEKIGMVGAWAEALEDISSDYLEEYYRRATKTKTNGFPVNALDIIAEWNKQKENRRLDRHYPEEQRGKWY